MSNLQLGELAPDFELPEAGGKMVRLSDFRGQYVVLYFYPKDMTPGCTTQACDFRDFSPEFSRQGAVIIGISADDTRRHQRFIEKHELPFMLLSDVDHVVSEQYGVWQLKRMYGREFYGIVRSTFVIGKDGELLMEWRKVRVKNHVEEVLDYLRSLQD